MTLIRRLLVFLISLLLTLTSTASSLPSSNRNNHLHPRVHFLHPRQNASNPSKPHILNIARFQPPHNPTSARFNTPLAAPLNAKLEYFGGPILSYVQINPIFYGTSTLYQQPLLEFYKSIAGSTYIESLNEYKTPTQSIGRGMLMKELRVSIGSTVDGRLVRNGVLSDEEDIAAFLRGLVREGKLKPNRNSYYPIHFAPSISLTYGSFQSCLSFCAYHSTLDISDIYNGTQKYLYYAVIPDFSAGCLTGCGTAPTVFQNLCSVSSHELTETITNPAVGLAADLSPPLAWYDRNFGEVADICNADQGEITGTDGKKWTVQKNWSNERRNYFYYYDDDEIHDEEYYEVDY
ncbi:hypothetical protein HDV05_007172 [Chytridiales sp. JEL 0842]|nr:hypothetical protein HDV05_007172 [Chytridiales sp. JEL 0842]